MIAVAASLHLNRPSVAIFTSERDCDGSGLRIIEIGFAAPANYWPAAFRTQKAVASWWQFVSVVHYG
jgi:hypothetical protein